MSGRGPPRNVAREADSRARAAAQTRFERPLLLVAGAGTGKTAALVARIVAWSLGRGWEEAERRIAERPRPAGAPPGSRAPESVAARVLERVVAITFTEAAAAEMASRVAEALAGVATRKPPSWILPEALPADEARRVERAAAPPGRARPARRVHDPRVLPQGALPQPRGGRPAPGVHGGRRRRGARGGRPRGDRALAPRRPRRAAARRAARAGGSRARAGRGRGRGGGTRERGGAAGGAGAPTRSSPPGSRRSPGASRTRSAPSPSIVGPPPRGLEEGAQRRPDRGRAAGARPTRSRPRRRSAELQGALEYWPAREPARAPPEVGQGPGTTRPRRRRSARPARNWRALARALCAAVEHALGIDEALLGAVRAVVAPLVEEVRQTMRRRGAETFDALLRDTRDLLVGHPEVAARERGAISQLLVDEFQDTDPLQCEIVRLLALEGPPDRAPRAVPGRGPEAVDLRLAQRRPRGVRRIPRA